MEISVTASSFGRALAARQLDLPRAVEQIAGLGIRRLELMDTDVRSTDLTALRRALVESSVTITSYDLFCDVDTPSVEERKQRVRDFHASLRQAAELGASCVMVIPGIPGADSDPPAARIWFREALRESLPIAADLDLTLTIENLGFLTELYGKSREIMRLCEEVGPELKVTFDVGNSLLAGEDAIRGLEQVWPRVAQVHLKDWKIVSANTPCAFPGVDGQLYQGTALGEGMIDLPRAIERLKALGYSGPVAVEYEGPDDPLAAIGRGVRHLRSLL